MLLLYIYSLLLYIIFSVMLQGELRETTSISPFEGELHQMEMTQERHRMLRILISTKLARRIKA